MIHCLHELILFIHKNSPQTSDGVTVHLNAIEYSLFFFFAKQFAAYRTDSAMRPGSVKLSDVGISWSVSLRSCDVGVTSCYHGNAHHQKVHILPSFHL